MPTQKPCAKRASGWNVQQLVEKLRSLARDLRTHAVFVKNDRSTNPALLAEWHRELAGFVADMGSLLAGEMPGSDASLAKAEELRGVSQILAEWAAWPTDATGNQSRAAQLLGVSDAVEAFAERLL